MTDGSGFLIGGALIFIGFALHRIADAIFDLADKMNLVNCAIRKVAGE